MDGTLLHRRVTPSIKFFGTHLDTWVERGTVRGKCLAHEHIAMSLARSLTRTAPLGVERTNHEATAPPTVGQCQMKYQSSCLLAWFTFSFRPKMTSVWQRLIHVDVRL